MHSFTSALIAAAFATLTGAAPLDLPVDVPSVVSDDPSSLLSGVISSIGQVSSVEGEVGSVTGSVRIRDVTSEITDVITSIQSGISDVDVRDAQVSVAAIFGTVSTEVGPYTEQLTYLVPSNCTTTQITNTVASIQGPVINAVPVLQALIGADASVILAPTSGTVELTVSEVAAIVGGDLNLILAAAGSALAVAEAQGGDLVTDVEHVLTDLGNAVTDLVAAVLVLVDGLAASLGPVVSPVDGVIADLQLTELADLLDVNI